MVEPAVLLVRSIGEKLQCAAHPLGGLLAGDPAVFRSDADCGKPEARGSDTSDIAARTFSPAPIRAGAIEHQTRAMVSLLPEIEEGTMLEVFEEGTIRR